MTTGFPRQPRAVTYAGFGVALALLALAALITWRSQRLYQDSVRWTNHSYDVLDQSSQLLITIQRAEGSARGYAITRLPFLRQDALVNLASVPRQLAALDTLLADNEEQRANLEAVRPLVHIRVATVDSLIALRDRPGVNDSAVAKAVEKGAAVSFPLRRALTRLTETERRLLDERSETTTIRGQLTLVAVTGALVLALLIIWAASSVTMRELHERTRAEAALKLEAERQAVIIEVQQAIATARPGDQGVMELVVEQAMQLTGADGAALTFVEGDDHVARTARGDLVPWVGRRNPLAASLTGAVLLRREPEIIPDVLVDPRTDRAAADPLGTRSSAILPILSGETAVGALVISSKRPNAFSSEDFAALRVMSGIVSAGVTNAAAFAANERLLAELRASRDVAEAANRAKSSFLATMSHELRTPLNSVIGFANILLRNKEQRFGEKDLQFLSRIKENGTQLLHLINDVLDVSKIEAGRMEVRPVPTDLASLIHETVAHLEPQARERGVALEAEVPPALAPAQVDPTRFRQVLINLIGNALKFTEKGSVRVVVAADAQGRPSRVDVIDTGIGIPPDRLAAVFEAFTQADATTERRFGGTGLGLTISRALLKLMGADLAVTSTVGVGSTFSVILPAPALPATPEAVAQAITAHAPAARHAEGAKPLVLVVDDEHDSRALLRTYLEEDGYRTAEASDGAEGLSLARELRPALITLDIRMPNVDGLSMLRQLRNDPELADIPVVVVSIEAAEHRGALIGAVDTLAKPVEREALLGVIERARPAGRRLILVVDDDAHTRQLLATLLGAEGYKVLTAADGLGAINLLQTEAPDLVLLDLMMPVMDGGTFLAALRNDARTRGIPVAVITALDADSEAVRRLSSVAQAVIQKGPALEQSLHQLIEQMIGPARD